MAVHAPYTEARASLAWLWDRTPQNLETDILSRRGSDDIALIASDELATLQATALLLGARRTLLAS